MNMVEYGTGWGRTRHILVASRDGSDRTRAACGASIDRLASPEEVNKKPICRVCARSRHITPCTHCGGTGQEPAKIKEKAR